jgi:hypothetical protein
LDAEVPECKKLENTMRSERTKTMYLSRLKQYCDAVGKNPDELIEFKIDGLRNVATTKEFQAENLLNEFLFHSDLVATAQVIILASVKSFYKANCRELNKNVGQGIELPEPKKRTPKLQDILELEDAMTNARDKAILWFLASAPFRRATLTKLKWTDLKSTEILLKQIREESKGQGTRTPEQDAEIASKIPFYLVIESARLKGARKVDTKALSKLDLLIRMLCRNLQSMFSSLRHSTYQ